LSLLVTLLLVAGLVELIGGSATGALSALITGVLGSRQAIVETMIEATPTALCGLAFLIPFKAGFFNIGAQGQLQLGALAAVYVTTGLALPATLMIPLTFAAAAVAGMLLIVLPLVLKTKRGASEVTTTVMLNFVAVEFVLAMVTGPMKQANSFFAESDLIPVQYRLPVIVIHIGFFLMIAIVVIAGWILKHTVFGFRLEALGANPSAAEALGMRTNITLTKAVLAAGALAGFAGGVQALGVVFQVAEHWAKPWGFLGILAALIGGSPVGVMFAALLLAGLEIGGRNMQAMTGVPAALVFLVQALPVLVLLAVRSTRLFKTISTGGVSP
jgi:simple sugar transport system permease protein